MHPILYILYYFFKSIIWVSLRLFYSKITVVHPERGRFKNPCIVISNHPSTLLDPLNTAVEIKTEVHFLANASLFKTRFGNWFFNTFYCIPVERYEDTGGKPLDNKASFEKSTRHLAKGGCLYLAPEGTSFIDRRLRKVKTGMARIALAAESQHNFQLGLTILPVGLNYSDSAKLRSEILTIIGEPIPVADFQKDWEQDEVEAVQNLTARMGAALSGLVISTEDEEEDQLLRYLEAFFQNENRLEPHAAFQRTKTLLANLQDWKMKEPAAYGTFLEQVFSYFEKLKALKISDEAIKTGPGVRFYDIVRLLLTFPFLLLGLLIHFLPVFFTQKISNGLNKDLHWAPTYRYLSCLVSYLFFTGSQLWLVGSLAGGWFMPVYLAAFFPLGWAAEEWLKTGQLVQERFRLNVFTKNKKAEWEKLMEVRSSLAVILMQKNTAV